MQHSVLSLLYFGIERKFMEEQDSLQPHIIPYCQRKYADCRKKTMEILMRAKAGKGTFLDKGIRCYSTDQSAEISKHKTPGRAKLMAINQLPICPPVSTLFFSLHIPNIIFCLYFSLYLHFFEQVWPLNHFCSPV